MGIFVLMIVIGLVMLNDYGAQWDEVKRTTEEIREEVKSEEPNPTQAALWPTSTPIPTPIPTPGSTLIPEQEDILRPVEYPGGLQVNAKIRKARKKSEYIMGWLTMDDVDEPVVQKDNDFFLDHDAMGKKNINGALFMDENTEFLTRPYTILIYGHNMKSGAMFGNLKKYEKADYCRVHRMFRFESLYEEGEYEIFAVATIRLTPGENGFVNVRELESSDREIRKEAIARLRGFSLYYTTLDVNEEDQIILLITCVGDEDQRLVVAGKRI